MIFYDIMGRLEYLKKKFNDKEKSKETMPDIKERNSGETFRRGKRKLQMEKVGGLFLVTETGMDTRTYTRESAARKYYEDRKFYLSE